MRGNALTSLAVAGLASCSGDLTVVVALPPNADRIAILAESASGNRRFATPIREIDRDGPTFLEIPAAETDGALVFALAWRSSDLGALPIGSVPIRRASTLDPILPPPMFAARGSAEGGQAKLATIIDPAEFPPVTIDQLDACPRRVVADAVVDTRCGAYSCAATLVQDGCALELDAESCLLGSLTGRIDAQGKATLNRGGAFGPCTEAAASGADVVIGLECARGGSNTCSIDLVSLATLNEPFADVEMVNLTAATPGPPAPIRSFLPGVLTAIATTRDRIVVAGTPGARADPFCRNAASALWLIDPATMQVETATAPECVTLLAADPGFGGFLGVFGGQGSQSLGRFTERGQLVQQHRLRYPDRAVTRIATSLDPPLVYLALSGTADDVESQVVALKYGHFDEHSITDPKGEALTDLFVLEPEKVVVIDSQGGDALQFEGGQLTLVAPYNLACGLMSSDPMRILPLDEPERWVTSAISDSAEILVLTQDARAACEAATSYAVDGEPWALVRWPDRDREDIAVGIQTRAGDAVVALYDARAGRFLPKRVQLGVRGPISEMVVLEGGVFGLLPSEGSIFKLILR